MLASVSDTAVLEFQNQGKVDKRGFPKSQTLRAEEVPRYVIHIGPPKAGSKYIQSQLFHSRQVLESQGVLYPGAWWSRPDKIMHDELKNYLREGKDLSADFANVNASGARIVVLSCEAFDGLEKQHVEQLRKFIGDNPVDIVYYVRRWSDHIPSWWRQEVMMGDYITLPEFYIKLLSNPLVTRVNAAKVWETYQSVFGREAIRLVSFSNLLDHGVDLFRHFCEVIIGLAETPKIVEGLIQQNVSPGNVDQEVLRTLNYVYFRLTGRRDQSTRIKLHKLREKYDFTILTRQMELDTRRIKLDDKATSLESLWKIFGAYRDRLVSPEYGKDLFERRSVEVEYVGQNYLLQPGVVEEVMKLYEFLTAADVDAPELRALQSKR